MNKIFKKFTRKFGFEFGISKDSNASKDLIMFNGFFDESNEEIELEIVHHPKTKFYTLSEKNWHFTKVLIVDAILHESIHKDQYIQREISFDNIIDNGMKPEEKLSTGQREIRSRKGI